MPSERQLYSRAEDPHLIAVIIRLHRKRRFAQIHLACDRLHQLLRTWVEDDAKRITAEGHIREDINQPVTKPRQDGHATTTPEALQARRRAE
jgi:hypothetical protein